MEHRASLLIVSNLISKVDQEFPFWEIEDKSLVVHHRPSALNFLIVLICDRAREILIQLNEKEEAIQHLKEAIKLNRNNAEITLLEKRIKEIEQKKSA